MVRRRRIPGRRLALPGGQPQWRRQRTENLLSVGDCPLASCIALRNLGAQLVETARQTYPFPPGRPSQVAHCAGGFAHKVDEVGVV